MELLSLTVLGGLVLIVATIISFTYSQQATAQKTASGGQDLCGFLAREINTAASFGDGYARSFTLPVFTNEFSYSVEFVNEERRVFVSWNNGGCFKPLVASVTGSLKAGVNSLQFENGGVVLN